MVRTLVSSRSYRSAGTISSTKTITNNRTLVSTNFVPTDVAGLKLWLKADVGVYNDAGVTLATNSQTVRQWNDQSGSGNNISQSTSGNRPVYKTNQFQGLPAINFVSASNNYMDGTFAGGALSQPTTVFVVARQLDFNNNTFYDTNTGSNEQVVLSPSSAVYTQYAGTNQSGGSAGGNLNLLESVYNAGSSFTNNLGTQIISGNVGSMTFANCRLGANPSPGSYLNGYICEFLVYTGTLSSADRTSIRNYLKGRWWGTWPSTGNYALCAFNGSDTIDSLYILSSSNGTSFTDVGVSYFPNLNYVRDPSITVLSGTKWIAHTNVKDFSTKCTSFSVASSSDGIWYSWVADVDCSSISGSTSNARTWAPEWFVDDTAPQGVRVFVAISSTGDPGNFQLYETHPTNAAFTTWSALVQVTGTGLPAAMIDPYMVKIGSTYYLWYKNETTLFIEVMSSTSLTSGYTVLYSGNWMGIGSGVEGASVIQIGGIWYLYCDDTNGIKYTTQTTGDWTTGGSTTWGALTLVTAPYKIDHGTVLAL